MAHNAQFADNSVDVAVDAMAALCNGGYIKLYTANQPVDANTSLAGQTLLATLRFGATAFQSAVAGVATANTIAQDSDAAVTGTAAWFRVLKSDNSTVVFDGSIGTTSDFDMVIATTSIVQHAIVTCSLLTLKLSES